MGKKGPTKHIKRNMSPRFWPIHRKTGTWAVKTSPGPHSFKTSIPLNVIIRDLLHYASSAKEAKMLVKLGKILVDNNVRKDEKFPIGLMDVISIPDSNEIFRLLPDHGGKMRLHKIDANEGSFKLCKIIGKNTLRNGIVQLNFHDGKNIQILSELDNYQVNDVVKIKIPEKEILDHIEFKERSRSLIIGGRSQGATGVIIGFGPEPGWKKTATIRTEEGNDIRTLSKYVFVIGEDEPMISLKAGDN